MLFILKTENNCTFEDCRAVALSCEAQLTSILEQGFKYKCTTVTKKEQRGGREKEREKEGRKEDREKGELGAEFL